MLSSDFVIYSTVVLGDILIRFCEKSLRIVRGSLMLYSSYSLECVLLREQEMSFS